MCGIAGILNKEGGISVEMLHSLQSLLNHRGPDAREIFISNHQRIGLAHTRLSIQDLSTRAGQPMTTPDGRYTVVFNGEIYNFKILRKELETQGVQFFSDSDTEVILKLYQFKKEKCLKDLEGMFAFAIWDEAEQECFFARDPLGIKPFYYLSSQNELFFASEYKALQRALNLKWMPDSHALHTFLIKGSVAEPFSSDIRIRMLPAGNYFFWRKGVMENPIEYWSPAIPSQFSIYDPKQAITVTRRALLESVEKHFVSDVQVGLFLSGGLDSTALLALSRELGHARLTTYTIGFKNLSDETQLARRTAKHFGAKHHEIVLDSNSADQMLDGYFEATDQPTIDGYNIYVISKFAHDHGAKVILSGLGGDELFGGYNTLQAVPQLFKLARSPVGRTALSIFASSMRVFQKSSKWKRLHEMLQKKDIPIEDVYAAYRGIFNCSEADQILETLKIQPHLGETIIYSRKILNLGWDLADQVDWLEWTVYLREQLLRDADIFSMSFGLELRVPFVDSKLFETITQITPAIRLNRKNLLKIAVPEIPDWILKQPKRGFLFPFSNWNILDRHFKSIEIKRLAANYSDWYQKWALLQLDHLISNNR